MVEDFIAAKLTPGLTRYVDKALTRSSLRVGLIALRLILQRAVQAGHLASNPVVGLGRFQRQEDRGRIRSGRPSSEPSLIPPSA